MIRLAFMDNLISHDLVLFSVTPFDCCQRDNEDPSDHEHLTRQNKVQRHNLSLSKGEGGYGLPML